LIGDNSNSYETEDKDAENSVAEYRGIRHLWADREDNISRNSDAVTIDQRLHKMDNSRLIKNVIFEKPQETHSSSNWVDRMNHLFESAPNEDREKDAFIHQNTSGGVCDTFYPSFKENLYKVMNYSFNVDGEYLKLLKLDADGIRNLTANNSNSSYPVIATAASSNHFHEIQGLIRDYHTNLLPLYPDMKLILYDLGLSTKHIKQMNKHCKCEVRRFPFHMFPDHIRMINGYGWKPLIIQLLLREFDFVMWTDASVRFNGNPLDKLFKGANKIGVQAIPGWGSIAVRTNSRTFSVLTEQPCLFDYPEFEATWMAFKRSEFTLTAVMRPWVSCALQYGCMDFKRSKNFLRCPRSRQKQKFGSCHRFDQSVMGIILTRLFNHKSHLCQFIVNGIGDIKRGEYVRYFPDS
jgi:hypothetical protein